MWQHKEIVIHIQSSVRGTSVTFLQEDALIYLEIPYVADSGMS